MNGLLLLQARSGQLLFQKQYVPGFGLSLPSSGSSRSLGEGKSSDICDAEKRQPNSLPHSVRSEHCLLVQGNETAPSSRVRKADVQMEALRLSTLLFAVSAAASDISDEELTGTEEGQVSEHTQTLNVTS